MTKISFRNILRSICFQARHSGSIAWLFAFGLNFRVLKYEQQCITVSFDMLIVIVEVGAKNAKYLIKNSLQKSTINGVAKNK